MAPMRPWARPVNGRGWLPYKIRVQKLPTAAVLGMERSRSGSQRQATATNARRCCKTLVPTDAHAWRPCFDYLQHHGSQTSRTLAATATATATAPPSLPSTGTESRCQTRCNAAKVVIPAGGPGPLLPWPLFVLFLAPASRPDCRLLRAYVRSGPS
ncbi:hypothetical protein HDV64DRAFT_282020 [Trichoderma sp. TUCIM 5745]